MAASHNITSIPRLISSPFKHNNSTSQEDFNKSKQKISIFNLINHEQPTMSSIPHIAFHRPAFPNALPDEPAEYFREPVLPEQEQQAQNFPNQSLLSQNQAAGFFHSSQVLDADEPAEYFRSPTLPASFFRAPKTPADDDEPAEYFRPSHLDEIDEIHFGMSPAKSPFQDEPEEYFRPANIGGFENEIFGQTEQLNGQQGINDLYFPDLFVAEHSSAENPQLNRLLQSLPSHMPQAPVELGDGMGFGDDTVDSLPLAQVQGVYSELDARVFAALTGMQIPREQIQFDELQRHDCPSCNCGHKKESVFAVCFETF